MALLKCPNCNQTVLSAACSCPRCGTVFNWERDRYPGDKPIRWWPIVLGIAAVATLAFAVGRVAEQDRSAEFPPLPMGTEAIPLPALDRDTTTPATAEPPAPRPADTARSRFRSPAPPVDAAPPPQSRRASLPDPRGAGPAQPRWTSTWVNVRERPSNQSAVVRVLNPGERVEVESPNRSWSLIYVGGRPVGYLSVSLLVIEPPGP